MTASQTIDSPSSSPEPPTFDIAGIRYRIEPLSWAQLEWLGDTVFRDVDMTALDDVTLQQLLAREGPRLMALTVLADGQSRAEKGKAGRQAAEALTDDFAAEMTPDIVMRFATYFFALNPPAQWWPILAKRARREQDPATPLPSAGNGSERPSACSPTETSPVASG